MSKPRKLDAFAENAELTARHQRDIQKEVDRADKGKRGKKKEEEAMQVGGRAHPCQRGRTGTGLGTAQSRRQARQGSRELRQQHGDETGGAAGGDCARLRIHGGAELLELHHRRDSACRRGLPGLGDRHLGIANFAIFPGNTPYGGAWRGPASCRCAGRRRY